MTNIVSTTGELRPARSTHAAAGRMPWADDGAWQAKLSAYRRFLRSPIVAIDDPHDLSGAEHRALSARLDAANMALYRVRGGAPVDHDAILALARQFGLRRAQHNRCAGDDAVSDITPRADARRRYIPYTTRPLGWHTDGYYEPTGDAVRAFILHCTRQAASGGANQFLDHEILHGCLARQPSLRVDALFDEDAFSIPPDEFGAAPPRPPVHGAVFMRLGDALHMRYTARRRHIRWKTDPPLQAAKAAIRDHLERPELVLTMKLAPGMGVICRNVLHRRDAFSDEPGMPRWMLRARYRDSISPGVLSGNRDDLA